MRGRRARQYGDRVVPADETPVARKLAVPGWMRMSAW
jgi:hypothetical protein